MDARSDTGLGPPHFLGINLGTGVELTFLADTKPERPSGGQSDPRRHTESKSVKQKSTPPVIHS